MARILVLDTLKHPRNSGTANIVLSSDETTTMPTVNINGGQIDSTTIGASNPSTVAASTLSSTGNTTVGGTLGVTGVTTLSSTAAITGNTTVGGTLGVTGATTLAALTVSSITSTGTAIVGGATISSTQGNFAFGINALDSFTSTGDYGIIAIGKDALTTLTTASVDSIAIGREAMKSMVGGSGKNVAIGYLAMRDNLQNSGCVAIGSYALYDSDGGSNNVCIGGMAGRLITSSNNICIGSDSGTQYAPSGEITNLGDRISLGNDNIGYFYCATSTITTSDGRDKADVEDFTAGLDWIESMRPIVYRWDKRNWYKVKDEEGNLVSKSEPDGTHKKNQKHIGFIAQEVLEIEKAHGFANDKEDMLTVNLNDDDTAYGMKYERVVPILVNAIKELSQSNKELSTRIATLETK